MLLQVLSVPIQVQLIGYDSESSNLVGFQHRCLTCAVVRGAFQFFRLAPNSVTIILQSTVLAVQSISCDRF